MKDFQRIYDKHQLWLDGHPDGERGDFSGEDLRGIDLRQPCFRGANLSGANLSKVNLVGASLKDANLSGANLSGAKLLDAVFCGANLTGAKGLPKVAGSFPIHRAVATACETDGALNMGRWHHPCGTSHCRAGWAVVLHPQGWELEREYGTGVAGALIYWSCAGMVPDFYANNESALADIRRLAAETNN